MAMNVIIPPIVMACRGNPDGRRVDGLASIDMTFIRIGPTDTGRETPGTNA